MKKEEIILRLQNRYGKHYKRILRRKIFNVPPTNRISIYDAKLLFRELGKDFLKELKNIIKTNRERYNLDNLQDNNEKNYRKLFDLYATVGEDVRNRYRKAAKDYFGFDTSTDINTSIYKDFAREGTNLIKDMQNDIKFRIQKATIKQYVEGSRDELKDMLIKYTNYTKYRIDLIATDQTQKLCSKINEAQQTSNGIEEYTWVDSGDNRVRPSHENYNGKIFKWSIGSPEGNPGMPVRCRCSGRPLIDWKNW